VVLYNGKNAEGGGDPDLGPNAYAAGEALFDGHDPARLLAQAEHPDLKPVMPYEKTGQYVAGTTFAEGLVYFHGGWFLYYGCADSLVGVVTAPKAAFAGPGAQPGVVQDSGGVSHGKGEPQLVILDTDIGDDIDDAFALGLALKSPELKLLGVTTAYGDTELRARLTNRLLWGVGLRELLVMPGVPTQHSNVFTQAAYALSIPPCCGTYGVIGVSILYAGQKGIDYARLAEQVKNDDAVGFLLDQIQAHPGEITLIAIGPLNNVEAAIKRDPETFRKLKRVVMMGGSVYRGYDGRDGERRPPDAEWNINRDPAGARALLASGVPVFMMPLDSTQIHLETKEREEIFAHGSPLTDQLTLLYHQWKAGTAGHPDAPTLFDPVAVTYAIRPDLCPATPMRLEVDDKGFTRPVDGAPNAQVCLKSDEQGFLGLLLARLTGDAGR
jgi:inosine-uridine nucleoside N-ribohydrolase